MRTRTLLAMAIGLAVVAGLILANDAGRIAGAIAGAGWGVLLVIALHLPQTAASAWGWRPLILEDRPAFVRLLRLRFVREAVNALLPVAQVGGDVVRARLLARDGVAMDVATASCAADLTMEMASQAAFTVIGALALLTGRRTVEGDRLALGCGTAAVVVAAAFWAVQRLGSGEAIGRRLRALVMRMGWPGRGGLDGLGGALRRIYAAYPRLAAAMAAHLLSWLLGVLETGAGLWVLGLHPSWREALVVESLGQVIRALGFAIPGALGVQEGGYVLICGLFGIPASSALALSLIRRAREIALGVPGLAVWHLSETRPGVLGVKETMA